MQIVTGNVAAGTRAMVQRLHTYKGCIYLMLGKKQIPFGNDNKKNGKSKVREAQC